MKMRFDTECRKCRNPLRTRRPAVHIYGGYWHPECWMEYRKGRQMAVKEGTR